MTLISPHDTNKFAWYISNQPFATNFLTRISWGSIGLCGVLFVSQNNLLFRTLEAIVPSHSFAKIRSSLADLLMCQFTYLHKPAGANDLAYLRG